MSDLKQIAREIFHETLAAIDIPLAMERKLRPQGSWLQCDEATLDLRKFNDFRVVAIGKATHAMIAGLRNLLPGTIEFRGVASAPTPPSRAIPGIEYFLGGHPIPNAASWQSADAILKLLAGSNDSTLIFFLLSGGGSALCELPLIPHMTLADLQQFYRVLVTCGAPITEMNAVRKHFSAIKGGRLAVAAGRATKLTLAVTDVPGDHVSALASGPTLPDPTALADVERIAARYNMLSPGASSLRQALVEHQLPETPKPGHPAFSSAHFLLLLGMDDLFHPAHHALEARGFRSCCDNTTDDWPVQRAAEYLLAQLASWKSANPGQHVAVIADGEVSSPVTGDGLGGRNSAFVLSCVENIVGQRVAVLSAGTDGIDGKSPAAGAVADGQTLTRALAAGLHPGKFFARSDAYNFFARLDDAIVTGPTGNNLRDLRILLAEP
jgi:glycerate 2-kinase